jgi:hypothetical protein
MAAETAPAHLSLGPDTISSMTSGAAALQDEESDADDSSGVNSAPKRPQSDSSQQFEKPAVKENFHISP